MEPRPLVLAVDDEPPILHSISRLLAFEEVEVLTAADGAAALELLARHPVAVVLTDQHMPGLQGVELLRRARVVAPDTSRILFSGHIDIELLRAAVNGGEVYRFVTKPWDDDELVVAVRQGVERWLLLTRNRRLSGDAEQRARELEALVADRDRACAAHQRLAGLGRTLLDAMPLAVVVFGPAGAPLLANRLARQAWPGIEHGHPPAELAAWRAGGCAKGVILPSLLGTMGCEAIDCGHGALGVIGTPLPPELSEDP
jgi:DNA-binding NtrC family response regulator